MFGIDKTALIALASAASWGGGDFCGGMGSKAVNGDLAATMRLVMLAQAASLIVLTAILMWQHPALPHGAPMLWALGAGMCGSVGSVAFFKAISREGMGAPAAVSGLLAAAIPTVASSGMEGAPGMLRLAAFAMAAAAIWLIATGASPDSAGDTHESSGGMRETMGLAIFSGAMFGLYLLGLKLANPLGELMPVALARTGGLSLLGLLLVFNRKQTSREPRMEGWRAGWLWVIGLALLDTGGNLLYVAATRIGRLDVAAVLTSLYPAATILLAAWHLHERPTRRQIVGMATALVAVVMITV